MKPLSPRFVPPKAKGGIVTKLDREVLVYDPFTHTAHCLTESAAAILALCDGRTTVKEMLRRLEQESLVSVDETVVLTVLEQLSTAGLLIEPLEPTTAQLSRRQAVRRIGRAAALALPFVVSVVVPTPSEAVSCPPNVPNCSATNSHILRRRRR